MSKREPVTDAFVSIAQITAHAGESIGKTATTTGAVVAAVVLSPVWVPVYGMLQLFAFSQKVKRKALPSNSDENAWTSSG